MKIGGIVEQCNLILYVFSSLSDRPGAAGEILTLFAENNISLEYIAEMTCKDGIAILSLGVDAEKSDKISKILSEIPEIMQSLSVVKIEYVCLLGIYGPHFRERPSIAAKFCTSLGKEGINILGISSSISTISCIISARELEKAKAVIQNNFEWS